MHFPRALVALLLVLVLAVRAPACDASENHRPARIVSLIPAFTEDLFALGAGPQVVAVSQFTETPPAAHLPQVASFSWIDTERIVRLHPDLVVGIRTQASLVADVRRAGLRVILLPNDSYDDIFAVLNALGDLTGHAAQARVLNARLRARSAALAKTVRNLPRPRVFVVLGVAPIFTVSERSFIARLIELAGGRNAVVGTPDVYPRYSAEALVALQPDVIVADNAIHVEAVLDRPPWNALRAVTTKHVYVIEDPAILLQPGARYNEGVAWLISRLHPLAASTPAAR